MVGPNGAGKSTLIKSLVGILPPATGRIARDGLGTRDVAHLPQAAEVDRSFPITVADTVALGAWSRMGVMRGSTAETRRATAEALSAVSATLLLARRDRLGTREHAERRQHLRLVKQIGDATGRALITPLPERSNEDPDL